MVKDIPVTHLIHNVYEYDGVYYMFIKVSLDLT